MIRLFSFTMLRISLIASSSAFAAEKTITQKMKNMFCDACPLIVRKSLAGVPGVSKAAVSYKDKTAVVTYDDAKADVKPLNTATTKEGYQYAPQT
jgi:mercuric ion binding protein